MAKRSQDHNKHNVPIDGIKLISTCPLCHVSYDPLEAKILGEKEDTHLVHIQCRSCGNAILALILVSSVGVSSVGLITDLTYEDVLRFTETDEVTADHVLKVHEMLKGDREFMKQLI